jgi:hypothetical protein
MTGVFGTIAINGPPARKAWVWRTAMARRWLTRCRQPDGVGLAIVGTLVILKI